MTTLEYRECKTEHDINLVSGLADEIWHEYFPAIITNEQIDYMLQRFQSKDAITSQIEKEGYKYFALLFDENIIGYYAVHKEDSNMFLSKLYLRKDMRHKGFASKMFKEVKRLARREGCELIWLTVNKNNSHAISVYKHLGMTLMREQQTEIGEGFVMDDYVFGIMI